MDKNTSISIIVPVFNEVENVAGLHDEIKTVCTTQQYTYEIIFIDDGSSDGTYEVCKTLHPLKLIRLRRNFGQTAAMDAGIKAARYPLIVTMDGDGQNDPTDIPKLIEHMQETGLDIVSGWRKDRKDNILKKFFSRVANVLRQIIIHDGIHDSGCSLKIYKKECFENINLYGEMHRFIPAVLKIKGFTTGEIEVNHRPRLAGKTKYTWKRGLKGFVDMISVWFWHKFAVRPLHLLGGMGLVMLLIGVIMGILTIINYIGGQSLTDDFLAFLMLTFLLAGVILFIFGLIGDMLSKLYYGSKADVPYSIKDIYENEQ